MKQTLQIRVGVLVVLFVALTGHGEEIPSYTLEDCLRIGLERSIPLMNARRDEGVADARIRQVRSRALPSLEANGSYVRLDEGAPPQAEGDPEGREDNYSASLDASQLLYSGGSVRAALRAARSFKERSVHALARRRAELVRDLTKGFYDVLFAEANMAVASESVAQLAQFEKQSRLKYENETLSEFDWLSARVKLANEKPKLVRARNQYNLTKASFRDLLYLEEEDFDLDGEMNYVPVETDLDALYEVGLARRPELREAYANIEVLKSAVRVSKGDYLPEIRAVASYQGDQPDPQGDPAAEEWEWGWFAGLTARWSLLDGGLRGGEVLEKTLKKLNAEASLEDLQRKIRLQIRSAYLTLNNAREVVMGSQEGVDLGEKALDIARVRYDKGLSTYLEFTDSNLALSQARLIHYEALRRYLQALADLCYACGTNDLPSKETEP